MGPNPLALLPTFIHILGHAPGRPDESGQESSDGSGSRIVPEFFQSGQLVRFVQS